MKYLLFLVLFANLCRGQDELRSFTSKPLRGVSSINVNVYLIGEVDENLRAANITSQSIERDVELELRSKGIHMDSHSNSNLNVTIRLLNVSGREYCYSILIEFEEEVIARRNMPILKGGSSKNASSSLYSCMEEVIQLNERIVKYYEYTKNLTTATVWSRSSLGHVGSMRLSSIKDAIIDRVKDFELDLLTVNPK